ncbi:glycosylhydrolase-like jelly roll fold domain-containing protein [Ereboglobus luteus]|nr:glycosylhydrolase-like jelly roll fold domain-containing protein [Ereboglobus luteus]
MRKFGSLFIVFTKDDNSGMEPYRAPRIIKKNKLPDEWTVEFEDNLGAPQGAFKLNAGSWTKSDKPGIKYFSGTATYTASFAVDKNDLTKSNLIRLNLGKVRNLAEIHVNGARVATLWKEPFICDITDYVKPGKNELKIKITNTWANRMIGDEQHPSDIKWDDLLLYYKQEFMGYKISYIPDWIWTDAQRPVKERVSFTTWRFYEKDSPLEESGLLTDAYVEYGNR